MKLSYGLHTYVQAISGILLAHTLIATMQAPCSLQIEPAAAFSDNMLLVDAGGHVPETVVSVSNGQGQQIVRAYIAGHKTPFTVVQRLWHLKDGVGMTSTLVHLKQLHAIHH